MKHVSQLVKKQIKVVKCRYKRVQILCNLGFSIRNVKLVTEGERSVVQRELKREIEK